MVFSGGETQTFILEDKISVAIPDAAAGRCRAYWVKFIIDDVWAGNKYTDTAITKLLVNSEPPQ